MNGFPAVLSVDFLRDRLWPFEPEFRGDLDVLPAQSRATAFDSRASNSPDRSVTDTPSANQAKFATP